MQTKTPFTKAYHKIQKGVWEITIQAFNDTRANGWIDETKVFNTARSDITDAYKEIVGENFSKAVKCLDDSDDDDDEDKETVPMKELLPNVDEMEMLHQIDCDYDPIVKLSKFTQSNGVIIFMWLFMIR